MNKTFTTIAVLFLTLFVGINIASAANAAGDCRIAKNYIVTIAGGGYSMAGKILLEEGSLPSDRLIMPTVAAHANFIGTLTYTKALSPNGRSNVEAEARIFFDSNCTMHAVIQLGSSIEGNTIGFTAYSDDTASGNGVLVGDVLMSPGKYAGLTGAIRISAK